MVLFLLAKPFIDIFHGLKETVQCTPGQLAGVFVFVLCVAGIASRRAVQGSVWADKWVLLLGVLLLVNGSRLLFLEPSLQEFGSFVRRLLPVAFYFFCRSVMSDRKIYHLFLKGFLIAAFLPITLFLFEFFIHPIEIRRVAVYRGGGLRITGPYPDLFNYLSYLIGAFFIVSAYSVSVLLGEGRRKTVAIYGLLGVLSLMLIGLLGMKHQASWGVFVGVLLLLLYHLWRSRVGKGLAILLVLGGFVGGKAVWKESIAPLFYQQIAVVSSGDLSSLSLNGRVEMWQTYLNEWSAMPWYNQWLGVAGQQSPHINAMLSAGTHSEYLYLLFSSGIIGLLAFLFWLGAAFYQSRLLQPGYKYLVQAAVVTIVLFSITAFPLSAPVAMMYLLLMILASSYIPDLQIENQQKHQLICVE